MTQTKKPKKKLSKTGRILLDLLMVIAVLVMCFSGYQLIKIYTEYDQSVTVYSEIKQESEVTSDPQTTGTGSSATIDLGYLKNLNEDTVGWISLGDSTVDYPIVKGNDNVFYLDHMFNGEVNPCGSIFMDYRNAEDFSDQNIILYGHHMKNGTMFADIENYKNPSYYETHKEILILTSNGNYVMKPVAGILTGGDEDYVQIHFSSSAEYQNYINRFLRDSTFTSEDSIGDNDQMMLLSTCSYDVNDGRYVLIGKLEKSES